MIEHEFEQYRNTFDEFGELLLRRHTLNRERQTAATRANELGRFLNACRRARRINPEELAAMTGISAATIMALENGVITADEVHRSWLDALAEAFGEERESLYLLAGITPEPPRSGHPTAGHRTDPWTAASQPHWRERLGIRWQKCGQWVESNNRNRHTTRGRIPTGLALAIAAALALIAILAPTLQLHPPNFPLRSPAVVAPISPLAEAYMPSDRIEDGVEIVTSSIPAIIVPGKPPVGNDRLKIRTQAMDEAAASSTSGKVSLVPGLSYLFDRQLRPGVYAWRNAYVGFLGDNLGSQEPAVAMRWASTVSRPSSADEAAVALHWNIDGNSFEPAPATRIVWHLESHPREYQPLQAAFLVRDARGNVTEWLLLAEPGAQSCR